VSIFDSERIVDNMFGEGEQCLAGKRERERERVLTGIWMDIFGATLLTYFGFELCIPSWHSKV
jgi:hypothetical protein